MKVGDTLTWSRTFSEEEIRLFAELSGDKGEHHFTPDAQGRIMAHGLLTATLPTKIGGDLNFIARELVFRFVRPVFAGDTIECSVRLTSIVQAEQFRNLSCDWICTNQHGKEVMTGHASGVVRNK